MNKFTPFLICLFIGLQLTAQTFSLSGEITAENGETVPEVEVFLQEKSKFIPVKNGSFEVDSLFPGNYTITVFSEGYETTNRIVKLTDSDLEIVFKLKKLSKEIKTVSIEEKKDNQFGISRLKPVEGTAIYAGKKSEVVEMENMTANLATNNTRQVYSKVAGLNIWESDGAGIQLGIGGRGLNPNRVSNFNTRQNGYDISADALGYPESYYSPPTEALDRIEIVRGAASLQYGTQFGGFINFKLKDGPKTKAFELVSRQTVGSFGLFNSFNSIGGNHKKLKYYTYYQFKTGDGWRPNSEFDVHNAHLNLSYQFNSKTSIGVEYTFMNYLAQQAGGLTDFEFNEDPQQSNRSRNWFRVNWNLIAFHFDHKISDKTDFNFRAFGLLAGRDAVGNLDRITQADIPGTPRDLLSDQYSNFGFENRLLHRYSLFNNTSVFLIGMRYYNGHTDRNQGNGSSNADADFNYEMPKQPEDSRYEFPSQNLALFTENVFYISPKLSITPGLRFEYISTNADGYYFDRFIASNGDTLKNNQIFEERNNDRSFILAGIGVSYKPAEQFELYANFSENYRSINFNDMRIDNPNYEVDPNLKDETGFSADLGIRGNKNNWFNYDISLFLLSYDNRIGNSLVSVTNPNQVTRVVRLRTNISDSRSIGLESFVEINLLPLFGFHISDYNFSIFSNFSLMDARYIDSKESAFDGNEVELVPQIIFKGGANISWKKFKLSYQYSYTAEQYTDATNADFASNAVYGIVPEYAVMDLSASYKFKKAFIESGVNNLMDNYYFTRRASGYPGPGIIPSDPRNFYFTLGIKL
ncbi:MAG: TonB-dependent receptor [Vicingaceae bacterium]